MKNLSRGGTADAGYIKHFHGFINNDLSTPRAVALMWEMLSENIPDATKYANIIYSDQIFSLQLDNNSEQAQIIPSHILQM
jgi:cysteinyl-tRNA synthetase